MAEKSIAQKLLIRPGTKVWCSDPRQFGLLGPLPDGVIAIDSVTSAETGVVFAADSASLRATLAANRDGLAVPATFWVAYPKGNRTDMNRDSLWPILTEYGMRPIGQVAINDVWSALRFRPLREGEAPFTGGR